MIVCSSRTATLDLKGECFKHLPGENTKLFFGVELELEANKSKCEGELFKDARHYAFYSPSIAEMTLKEFEGRALTKRESLDDGFEICTVPATLAYHRKYLWNKFFEGSAKYLKITSNTGMHIHFSREGITEQQLARTIYFIHETENRPFLNKIAGRSLDSPWCTQRKKRYTASETAIILEETHSRSAISISARTLGKSVEVRIWRAVTKFSKVIAAMEFLTALFEYVGQCQNTEKALLSSAFMKWFCDLNDKTNYSYFYQNLISLNLIESPVLLKQIRGVARRR